MLIWEERAFIRSPHLLNLKQTLGDIISHIQGMMKRQAQATGGS